MAIFNSYVSLPEGTSFCTPNTVKDLETWMLLKSRNSGPPWFITGSTRVGHGRLQSGAAPKLASEWELCHDQSGRRI